MDLDEIRKKVRCGACWRKITGRVNMVALDERAKWKYPSHGNVITGEEGGAIAFLCDYCVENHKKILEAVEWRDGQPVYHPLEELTRKE